MTKDSIAKTRAIVLFIVPARILLQHRMQFPEEDPIVNLTPSVDVAPARIVAIEKIIYLSSERISMRSPDFRILRQGSDVLAEPVSSRARCWLVCNSSIERWP